MAKKLDKFSFKYALEKAQRHRRTMYPWAEWTNGAIWRIYQGEDFTSQLDSMQSGLHKRAYAMGISAQTVINKEEKSITFQFLGADDGTN